MPSGLRFDRVAREFIHDVEESLSSAVPEGRTLVVTVTAPLRRSGETAASVQAWVRGALAGAGAALRLSREIHGNAVAVQLIPRGSAGARKVVVFVHNRDVSPGLLVEASRVALGGS